MKIVNNTRCGDAKNKLINIKSVKFGSLIKLDYRPEHWPHYKFVRGAPVVDREFMLTGGYYGKENFQQIACLATGECAGLKSSTYVEVLAGRGEMNISYDRKCEPDVLLKSLSPGDTLRFLTSTHQKHKKDDVFLVNEVCGGYRPDGASFGSMAVTNLRSGALAYFQGTRKIEIIEAEVCVATSR